MPKDLTLSKKKQMSINLFHVISALKSTILVHVIIIIIIIIIIIRNLYSAIMPLGGYRGAENYLSYTQDGVVTL